MSEYIPRELYELTKLQVISYYKYMKIYEKLYNIAQLSSPIIGKDEVKIQSNNEQKRLYEFLYVSEAINKYYKAIEKVIESYEDEVLVNSIIKYIAGERDMKKCMDKEYLKELNRNI